MKILYVGHTYTIRANHAKLRAMAMHNGVEIILLTPQGWTGPLYNHTTDELVGIENLKHIIYPAIGIGKEGAYFFRRNIGPLLRRFQPDILHVEQGAYAVVYSQLIRAAVSASPQTRATFFTWWNLPYTLHGLKRITERYNLRHSAGAIAGNQAAAKILRQRGFEGYIGVMPQLGVDVSFESAPRNRLSSRPLRVGYVGRVEPEKGVMDLANALLRMQTRVTFVLVGAGSLVESVKAMVASGLELEYHEALRNEEVPPILRTLDVLVLPSRTTSGWVEQFGHILIEAMASGVAVVGSDSGEIPNVIGDAGEIFPEGDVSRLATMLEDLAANEERRVSLASRGQARARNEFSDSALAERQLAFFEAIMHSPPTCSIQNSTRN